MSKDPFQTTNARNTMDPQLLQNLNDLLITLSTCSGGVFLTSNACSIFRMSIFGIMNNT